jgi:type IV pilus assembly protein PilC
MATFLYKAKDETGLTLFGIIEAEDIKDIKKQMRHSEHYFISARHYDMRAMANIRLKSDDLLMFTNRLSYMIEAGLPILQALNILWKQSDNKELQIILSYIRKKIEDGGNLQEAFGHFPNVFPPIYLSMISVAEIGVGLVKILRKLSQYLQEQKAFVSRMKRATMYPAFVLCFAVLVILGMFLFVVPIFQKVISKLHGDLPMLTKILFGFSALLRNVYFWAFLAVVGVAVFFLWKYLYQKKNFRYRIDSWKLQAPLLKGVLFPLCVGRFTRSLGLLLSSGVPLLTAIEISKTTAVNARIESAVVEIKRQVSEGSNLYEAFKSTKAFPLLLVDMMGIGEKSGKLPQLLENVATHLEEEADYKLSKFLTLLEPMLIIIVGGMVLLVLLGIYLPVFSIQSSLRSM